MTETPRAAAADSSEQLNRLQKRVGALEWQVRRATAMGALGACLVGGAVLVLVGFALPGLVQRGGNEFASSETKNSWSAINVGPVGVLMLVTLLALLVLTVVTAVGTSPKLHLATHIVAAYVCGLPLAAVLLIYATSQDADLALGSGFYLLFIGVVAIAAAALARRRHLQE